MFGRGSWLCDAAKERAARTAPDGFVSYDPLSNTWEKEQYQADVRAALGELFVDVPVRKVVQQGIDQAFQERLVRATSGMAQGFHLDIVDRLPFRCDADLAKYFPQSFQDDWPCRGRLEVTVGDEVRSFTAYKNTRGGGKSRSLRLGPEFIEWTPELHARLDIAVSRLGNSQHGTRLRLRLRLRLWSEESRIHSGFGHVRRLSRISLGRKSHKPEILSPFGVCKRYSYAISRGHVRGLYTPRVTFSFVEARDQNLMI